MKTKQQIEDALVLATSNTSNAIDTLDDSDAIMEIVNEFAEEWQDADCDEEDATPEQKEALDNILNKYTNRIYDVINEPHSIKYINRNQTLEWYDVDGYHFLSEVRPFVWWDVDIYNVLIEMGYDSDETNRLYDRIEKVLPFNLPSTDECLKTIEAVLDGTKQIADLCNYCYIIPADTIAELVESGKDAESILDEIVRMTEN